MIFLLLDGSDEASLIALKASSDLDLAADLLATAEEGGDLEEAEKRIEDALEALLDAEIEGNQEEDDSVRRLMCFGCIIRQQIFCIVSFPARRDSRSARTFIR